MRRARLQIGERVCVFGLGLLGQLTVQLAKRAGCSVVAVGSLQSRLDLAKKYGADLVLNSMHDSIDKEINFLLELLSNSFNIIE